MKTQGIEKWLPVGAIEIGGPQEPRGRCRRIVVDPGQGLRIRHVFLLSVPRQALLTTSAISRSSMVFSAWRPPLLLSGLRGGFDPARLVLQMIYSAPRPASASDPPPVNTIKGRAAGQAAEHPEVGRERPIMPLLSAAGGLTTKGPDRGLRNLLSGWTDLGPGRARGQAQTPTAPASATEAKRLDDLKHRRIEIIRQHVAAEPSTMSPERGLNPQTTYTTSCSTPTRARSSPTLRADGGHPRKCCGRSATHHEQRVCSRSYLACLMGRISRADWGLLDHSRLTVMTHSNDGASGTLL